MSRHFRNSRNRKRSYDYGKEWRAVSRALLSQGISPLASLAQEKHLAKKPQVLMITISRNQNFKEWLNIKVCGLLVDNVKSRARAVAIANKLQSEHKQRTGETLTIVGER